MNQALFEPATGTIVGIRGQWLLQFNATTGAFIQAMRFSDDAAGVSCMTILNGKIYCGVLFSPITDYAAGNSAGRDIFVVDAATFALASRFNLGSISQTVDSEIQAGYRMLTNNGTRIAGFTYTQGSTPQDTVGDFEFDPTDIAGTFQRASYSTFAEDSSYDSVNGVYWIPDAGGSRIECKQSPFGGSDCRSTSGLITSHGITYNSDQNKVFCVLGDESFVEVNASDAVPAFSDFPFTTRHTGRINCNAIRVKSVNGQSGNAHNGKVLIPTWADDAVVIWDPATNAVESVQTGFTAPFDIVVCPTANWAVQSGVVGLKEIT